MSKGSISKKKKSDAWKRHKENEKEEEEEEQDFGANENKFSCRTKMSVSYWPSFGDVTESAIHAACFLQQRNSQPGI
jgi:hypothetical protein